MSEMTHETWRVECEDGVRAVLVSRHHDGWWNAATEVDGRVERRISTTGARAAVTSLAAHLSWSVVSIAAPGARMLCEVNDDIDSAAMRLREITALGEETGVRAAGPIIEALDAAAVRLARENAALRDELRAARETIEARDAEYAATLTDAELDEHAVSTVEDVACLAAQLRGAKTTIAELLRADEGERAAREERWSKYLADVERLTAERDAAFNRGVEAMREAAAQHFKRRSEGIEHAAARIACIAPTAAVCATLDEARRVADVADEIRALEVAP